MSASANCKFPLTRDPDQVIVGDCEVLEGGFKKPGAPVFTPTVVNEEDFLWRDEDFEIVQEENNEVVLIDNA